MRCWPTPPHVCFIRPRLVAVPGKTTERAICVFFNACFLGGQPQWGGLGVPNVSLFYGKRQEDSLTCRDALGTWTSKESGDSSVRWCVPVDGSVPTVVSSRILRRGGDYSLITPHLVVVDILLITTEPWCVANRDLRAGVRSLPGCRPCIYRPPGPAAVL